MKGSWLSGKHLLQTFNEQISFCKFMGETQFTTYPPPHKETNKNPNKEQSVDGKAIMMMYGQCYNHFLFSHALSSSEPKYLIKVGNNLHIMFILLSMTFCVTQHLCYIFQINPSIYFIRHYVNCMRLLFRSMFSG